MWILDFRRKHFPFEFRNGPKDVEEEFAGGCCGVDVFGQRDKLDAAGLELVRDLDQVLQRSGQAVQPPDDDAIVFPRETEQFVQSRPERFRTRDLVGKDPIDAGFFECVGLEIKILFIRAYSTIADLHVTIFAQIGDCANIDT